MDWAFAIQCIVGIIAITDPLGVVPIFLSVVDRQDQAQMRRVARHTTLTVCCTLILFAFLGQGILRFFGVTLPAFRVGGGILLSIMALPMLQGQLSPAKQNRDEAEEIAARSSVAIVPLGIPLLAGPGAISLVMLLSQQAQDTGRLLGLGAGIGITTLATFLALRAAVSIQKYFGRTEIAITTRVMGLIMIAVGVQFAADGLKELFPLLAQTHFP
ncbi:MAG: NAAT family transporter [Phycisphaeraceae bacterium]|nr:NAAT family transporter [Phycisphaeraceae bacterium]